MVMINTIAKVATSIIIFVISSIVRSGVFAYGDGAIVSRYTYCNNVI